MMKILRFLLWFFSPWVRRRAVLSAAREHDAYAYDRVIVRKRLGFDTGQRQVAVLQRARRALRGTGVRVSVHQVKKILREK